MKNDEKIDGGLVQIKKREDVCPGAKDRGELDLNDVRDRIDAIAAHDAAQPEPEKTGPEYWRSLEELAGSEAFQSALHREFPKGASEWVDSVSRRGFLKVMGASLGLAGIQLTGCVRLPLEPIVPYVRQPEGVIPGRPMYYATASTLGGYASPLLVESHLGRPTKVEGNDLHPASLGGTDIFAQASHPRPLRSRPLPDRHVDGRRPLLASLPRRDPRPAQRAESRCRAQASAFSRRQFLRPRSPTSCATS